MSKINVKNELVYDIQKPTSFSFSITSAINDYQKVDQEYIFVSPQCTYKISEVGHLGNRLIRLQATEGQFNICYHATVELYSKAENPPQIDEINYPDLPDEVLLYLNPSRYCESDLLSRFAVQTFGELAKGYSRVSAICEWIHTQLEYQPGSSNNSTSACDVLLQRTGVCRDYAHLAITLCRALDIPARYVSGYAVGLDPPDFHGLFEVFLGDRWYLFDATKMAPTTGIVRIATGRDAADAPFASFVGAATLQSIMVSAHELKGDIPAQSFIDQELVPH